jgi:hypothetical protein
VNSQTPTRPPPRQPTESGPRWRYAGHLPRGWFDDTLWRAQLGPIERWPAQCGAQVTVEPRLAERGELDVHCGAARTRPARALWRRSARFYLRMNRRGVRAQIVRRCSKWTHLRTQRRRRDGDGDDACDAACCSCRKCSIPGHNPRASGDDIESVCTWVFCGDLLCYFSLMYKLGYALLCIDTHNCNDGSPFGS